MSSSRAIVRKTRKEDDWIHLDLILKDRDKQGKESEVYEWGEKVPGKKLQRARARLRLPWVERQRLEQTMRRRTPLGFGILSPVSLDISRMLRNSLPFYEFEHDMLEMKFWEEKEVYPPSSLESAMIEDTVLYDGADTPPHLKQAHDKTSKSHVHGISNPTSWDLEAIMPPEDNHETWADHPLSDASLGLYVSPLYRRILFSVSNNFAGMGAYSFQEVIEYLRKETNADLYRIISSSSSYTAKAIIRNLFKGAIEVGDATLVRSLLNDSATNINPDLEICYVSDAKFTPIERASALGHLEIIKTLLQYHVDVNKSLFNIGPKGALGNAIIKTTRGASSVIYEKYQRVDLAIFELLLNAGGEVDHDTLERIIKEHDEEIFIRLMRKLARTNRQKWNKGGIFRYAFRKLGVMVYKELARLLVDVGADLNCEVTNSGDGTYPRKIIDMAARRGDLSMVQLLVEYGAKPTGDTLACAVSSGDAAVVKFFLKICAIDDIGTLRITPLAAAIVLKNPEMMELLEKHGAGDCLSKKDQFSSALRAASRAGDVHFLEHLVNLGGDVTPDDLGHALMVLAKGGHNQAAYILIGAGANLDTDSRSAPGDGPALLEALKRRDEELVTRLLNAGANPNYGRHYSELNGREPAIQLAVEWGNRDVVERLIFEGVDVNDCGRWYGCRPALSIAVDNRDEQMVRTLFDAGADANHPKILRSDTPLAAATKRGDKKMTLFLLDRGADPNFSSALKNAASLSSDDIMDLLIARYRKVYVQTMKGFGSSLLKTAVLQGNESRVGRLLKSGMDPTALIWDKGQGTSPFGVAISHDQPNRDNIVKLFLAAPCDPNGIVAAFSQGHFRDGVAPRVTALLAAVSTNDKSGVELLVRGGAKVSFPALGAVKRTPIQRAAERGLYEMVEFLIRLGADVNDAPASRGGGTALQLAALSGNLRTVKVLLDHKANVDAPTSTVNGRTALEAAAEHGRLDTVKMLLNARGMQFRGNDRPQFERTKQYARRNGHCEIVEMLECYEKQFEQLGRVEKHASNEGNMIIDED